MNEYYVNEVIQTFNLSNDRYEKINSFLESISYFKVTTYINIISQDLDITKLLSIKEADIIDQWDTLEFLFKYNIRLSMGIYPYIYFFELILKNKIHNILIKKFGEHWYKNKEFFNGFNPKTAEYLSSCINEAITDDTNPLKSIENKTMLGFWTSIITSADLWNSKRVDLKRIFDKSDISAALLKQKEINRKLTGIRLLRNNISHYDCIIVYPLYKSPKNIYYLWDVYQDILYLFDLMGVKDLDSLVDGIHCQPNENCKGNSFETLYKEWDFIHQSEAKETN